MLCCGFFSLKRAIWEKYYSMKNRGFCRFYKELYWGESVKKHTLVKWRLYHGRGQFTIYCIVRAMSDSDQLDIIHCAFLKQQYFNNNPAYVYGIAGSRKEAIEVVIRMTDEANKAGYEGKVLDYLNSRVPQK